MKIFISSVIKDFEPFRAAARAAIETLRHSAIMAEDFAAKPHSPQIACLRGVREADLVLLILGERYGTPQSPSGLSPTHEEYLEARGKKPILTFVQNGTTPEPKQAGLLADIQAWQGGFFRGDFNGPDVLKSEIIRAIHDYALAHASAPLDITVLEEKAKKLLGPHPRRERSNRPTLKFALAGGPIQQILRPAQLEDVKLKESIHRQALFGQYRLLDSSAGVSDGVDGTALYLEQDNGSRIQLDEEGSLLFHQPLDPPSSKERFGYSIPALIQEIVVDRLSSVIGHASWILDELDSTQRLSHVGIATTIDGAGYHSWQTQAEHEATPTSGSMQISGSNSRPPICANRPRAAMRLNVHELAEDLMVRLRRQYKAR